MKIYIKNRYDIIYYIYDINEKINMIKKYYL